MALLGLNTNCGWIKGVRDIKSGTYLNDAIITLTLYDQNNIQKFDAGTATPIPGASGLSADYKSGSNGEFYATIPVSVQLTVGTDVLMHFVSSNYGINRTSLQRVQRG